MTKKFKSANQITIKRITKAANSDLPYFGSTVHCTVHLLGHNKTVVDYINLHFRTCI